MLSMAEISYLMGCYIQTTVDNISFQVDGTLLLSLDYRLRFPGIPTQGIFPDHHDRKASETVADAYLNRPVVFSEKMTGNSIDVVDVDVDVVDVVAAAAVVVVWLGGGKWCNVVAVDRKRVVGVAGTVD